MNLEAVAALYRTMITGPRRRRAGITSRRIELQPRIQGRLRAYFGMNETAIRPEWRSRDPKGSQHWEVGYDPRK